MSFEAPTGLLLLAAVPIAALLLLRGLRLRRRPAAAFFLLGDLLDGLPLLPRSFLWRRRLQAALFLAALACAAVAAGGPVLGAADDPPRLAIILVDHLALRRDTRGRAEEWRRVTEAAAALARTFRRDDRILVARTDTGVAGGEPLSPRDASEFIGKLPPSALPSDPAASLDLLEVLARAGKSDFMAIVTAAPASWRAAVAGRGTAWQLFPVAPVAAAANHALLDVEVRPDPLRAGRVSLFCRAGSFGAPQAPAAELTLTISCDGRLLARRTLRHLPGESAAGVFPDLDAGAGLLRIELSPTDAYPDDNLFLAPLPERVTVPALLVSEENPPLEAALRSIPGLELALARPSKAADAARVTVQVYDRVAPPELAGNILAVAPPEGMPGFGYRGDAFAPRVVRADDAHFLLQGVSLENLRIRRLAIYEIPTGMQVLATADGYPLIAAGRLSGRARIVLLAFDPRENEWVFDPSFPILMANIAGWLAESPEGTRSSFLVGDALPEDLAGNLRALVEPGGRRIPRPSAGWRSFRFATPGRWRVEAGAGGASGEVFVNLLDESVSAALAPQPVAHDSPPPPPERPFRFAARGALLSAALLLLLLEQLVAPPQRAGRLS